jgi:hypothetical protein
MPKGLFPREASLASDTPDACRQRIFQPLFAGVGWTISWLRWLQHGGTHLYVLYLAMILMILLLWRLG